MGTGHPLRVGILVFDDAEELDVVGPYEVLAMWGQLSPLRPEVLMFSADGNGVRCAKGLRLLPDTSREGAGDLHVLVHPGGQGTRRLALDGEHLSWVRQMRTRVPLLASVCTGALDELVRLDPSVLVDTEARFVDDGDVVTSAGVSAGIDMALHLVARLDSPDAARQVRRQIQYDPDPPV